MKIWDHNRQVWHPRRVPRLTKQPGKKIRVIMFPEGEDKYSEMVGYVTRRSAHSSIVYLPMTEYKGMVVVVYNSDYEEV